MIPVQSYITLRFKVGSFPASIPAQVNHIQAC